VASCWDLDFPPSSRPSASSRDDLRGAGAGRYALTLVDTDAGDFEECCRCVACEEESSASLGGTRHWLVLRRRNGTTLALCPICADTCDGERRPRRD
jgi:hypothetical protein